MSTTPDETSDVGITVTETAAEAATAMLTEEGYDVEEAGLRLLAREKGCDCGDVAYGLEIEPEVSEAEDTFEQHGLRLVVGAESREYVEDLRLDYVDDFRGAGFMLESTAEKTDDGGCGCGGHHHH